MSTDVLAPVAQVPVPPIPDFDRAHGPATRWLLRRSLLGYAGVWAVGLLLAALGSPALQAFGLGLVLPGGGQLYAGQWGWAAVAAALVPVALLLWWLVGPVLLPPAVWFAAAVTAALTVDDGHDWATVVVPVAAVVLVVLGFGYTQVRFRVQRARGRGYNEQLSAAQPLMPSAAPAPRATEATPEDLKTLRYLMDLALQPEDSWDGFFFVKADQFREGAVRYQLNFVSYAAAMYQYTRTPAFTGYVAEAQRAMIAKMMHREVWSYWSLENLWGNLRWNPDPIVDDNVMYSGYLGLMLGLYETTTGDRRYHQPGSLELRWNDNTVFSHDADTIAAALDDNFARARGGQFPCEPNWIYPMCNTFGINSLIVHDRLNGTHHADAVVAQVRESYENGDYCEPDGRLTTARSEYFGFRHPMVGNMGDGITAYFLNAIVPDIGRRTWWLMEKFHLSSNKHTWNLVDPGNYGIGTDRFTRAVLAANAREYGNDVAADELVASFDDKLVEQDGAQRYKGLSVWGNLYLAMTQFGREDSFRGLVQDGFPEEWRTGPRLSEAVYPDVLVSYAVSDGQALDLVLQPGNGPVRTRLGFDRLVPGQEYVANGVEVVADADGRASLEVDLTDRLELRLTAGRA